MLDQVVTIISAGLGPTAVATVISLILTGRLRPRQSVEDMRKDLQGQSDVYKDLANIWKQAYDTSEAARREQEAALKELTELSRTSAKFIQSLAKVTGGRDETA